MKLQVAAGNLISAGRENVRRLFVSLILLKLNSFRNSFRRILRIFCRYVSLQAEYVWSLFNSRLVVSPFNSQECQTSNFKIPNFIL